MSYSPPLSERIRIQFEILCENVTDFMASSHLKKPVLVLVSIAVFMTMRNSRRSIKNAKMGGLMAGNSPYASPYGSTTATTGKKGFLSRIFGKKTTVASSLPSYGGLSSAYGGLSSSPYGTSGSSYGASMGLRGGATGTSPYGSTLGGGLGGLGSGTTGSYGGLGSGTTGSYGTGSSSFGSSFGGTGSYGSSSSLGGSTMGFGSSLSGVGGSGKATADLADSNPSSVMVVDPSIHFYDYGGSVSFGGQIETVQAPDSPGMVTQVLSQPGQNKVLVIDGGGQMNSAILDGQAASTALRNGWKGIIVYGAVRNAATLQGLSIGVKALGTNPRKGTGSMGQRGGVVNLSNAQFQSGWWVFADKDGILISQTDISGQGGYGSSGSLGGTSFGGTGMSSFGASSMGGTSTFGGTSSYGAGSLGGSSYGSGSTMGGLGGSSTLGGSSYGGSSFGGTSSYGASSLGGSSLGGTSPYGSTGYGSTGGGLGAYGRSTTGGLGYSAGGYSTGGYGSSLYGNSYSAKTKKNKVFKILLASSIAAIVWIVCLR